MYIFKNNNPSNRFVGDCGLYPKYLIFHGSRYIWGLWPYVGDAAAFKDI